MLTLENWTKGFLLDDEWLAGVCEEESQGAGAPAAYAAFIVSHETGNSVGYHVFRDLQTAMDSVNALPRSWKFESSSECGDCGHGSEDGEGCGKGACHQTCQTTGACELSS